MKYVKLLRDGKPVWGVLKGELVRTLAGEPFAGICYDGESLPLESCQLLAPCGDHAKLICVGKNYYDHAVEMGEGVPDRPMLFMKGANTVNHLVIKQRAKTVAAEEFGRYILGYTCLNDVTARDIQKGDGQWTRGKSMDGFAPMGPVLTDEVDPADLSIETRLNGVVVQAGRTSQFMTRVPELLAFITASMTLEPGDVVSTGTPAGVGPMKSGDVVEVEIQDIGTLRNYIR